MGTDFRTVPGLATGTSLKPRNIFTNPQSNANVYGVSLAVIDGTKARDTGNDDVTLLRAGLILGKITSGGKYANSIIGLTGVLHDTSVVTTTMTLPAAVVTEIARRIGASGTFKIIGPPTAAGTVATETVTYSAIASATTITITATSADFAAGSIIAPGDGSETPVTFVTEQAGIAVNDTSGTNIDGSLGRFLLRADLIAKMIVNLTEADASVQTWIKDQLNGVASSRAKFSFDNDR